MTCVVVPIICENKPFKADKMKPDKRRADMDQQIDANLKRAFESMANEPVPDRFTDLLNQLRASGTADKNTGNTDDK